MSRAAARGVARAPAQQCARSTDTLLEAMARTYSTRGPLATPSAHRRAASTTSSRTAQPRRTLLGSRAASTCPALQARLLHTPSKPCWVVKWPMRATHHSEDTLHLTHDPSQPRSITCMSCTTSSARSTTCTTATSLVAETTSKCNNMLHRLHNSSKPCWAANYHVHVLHYFNIMLHDLHNSSKLCWVLNYHVHVVHYFNNMLHHLHNSSKLC